MGTREMLEILDQSTARKTRHQPKGTKETIKANNKEKPGRQVKQTTQGRQKTKDAIKRRRKHRGR